MTASTDNKTQVGNELFCRNMAALWCTDPQLAIRIDEIPDERRLSVEATRSGDWTASIELSDGRPCYLHSRYDPRAEADKLAATVPIEDKHCFVICGMGLGYHVVALRARTPADALFVVAEPSLAVLATALSCVDFTEMIAARRLLFVTDDAKTRLHELLTPYNAVLLMGMQLVSHAPSERTSSEALARIRQALTDFIAYARTTVVTLVHNSEVTSRNIAYNLPTYLSTPPVSVLQDRFHGNPAIVVAAGPSLWKNIHLLEQAKGHAVICAVQTTYKPLLDRGIVPDFVTALDFHEMSARFFQEIDDHQGVHLVAEPKTTWHVIDRFTGPISILDSAFAQLLVGPDIAARAGLPPGATVAHLAFYLARYMGCDPILFVGQDLAFTGHVFYVPGVEVHKGWRGEINRFCAMETKEWERIARNRAIQRKVKDIHGHDVYTDELLFTYLEQFEKDFQVTDARLIDATEGGAYIRGTDVMTLADAMARYCAAPIPPERFAYRNSALSRDTSRLPVARAELAKRLDEVRSLGALCRRCGEVLIELEGIVDQPAKFNRLLARVDEIRARVRDYDRAYGILNQAFQLAELRRFTADRKIAGRDASVDDAERARRQLRRDREFVGSMGDGADAMADILETSIERIEKAMHEWGES